MCQNSSPQNSLQINKLFGMYFNQSICKVADRLVSTDSDQSVNASTSSLVKELTEVCFVKFPRKLRKTWLETQLGTLFSLKVKNDPRSEFSNLSNWKEEA